MSTQYSRILIKRSTTAGEVPTIPATNDHTDGSWVKTDIYKGEYFINLKDSKVYSRTDAGIVLLQVLNNFSGAAVPTATDDSVDGYSVGSLWYYGSYSYRCVDNTASAAVWIPEGSVMPIKTVTENYTITLQDRTILASDGGGGVVMTLPNATTSTGKIYNIVRTDAGAGVVQASAITGQTINGSVDYVFASQYEKIMIQSNGLNWIIIG